MANVPNEHRICLSHDAFMLCRKWQVYPYIRHAGEATLGDWSWGTLKQGLDSSYQWAIQSVYQCSPYWSTLQRIPRGSWSNDYFKFTKHMYWLGKLPCPMQDHSKGMVLVLCSTARIEPTSGSQVGISIGPCSPVPPHRTYQGDWELWFPLVLKKRGHRSSLPIQWDCSWCPSEIQYITQDSPETYRALSN